MPDNQCIVCGVEIHPSHTELCSDCSWAHELALKFSMPSVNLRKFEIDATTMRLLSNEQRARLRAVPLFLDKDTLTVAFENPTPEVIEAARAITQKMIKPVIVSSSLMRAQRAELG